VRQSERPAAPERTELEANERRGLAAGVSALAGLAALLAAASLIPGAPLHGSTPTGARLLNAIVPLLFVVFFVPALAYGVVAGTVKSDRDAARFMSETMSSMGAYIVLAFFAAQFIEYFRWSGLGEMIAISGGHVLASADLPTPVLLVAFVVVVAAVNFAIASMSAKYAFLAPVFIPMFMQVGISPELTQAAYRIGDSVTNCVTPLNPYLVIALVLMRRYAPQSGIGTLLALMLPFALTFLVVWSALLVCWIGLDLPLGPAGPLHYVPR
jgi:aminobenzoyl-glutamate transport protein